MGRLQKLKGQVFGRLEVLGMFPEKGKHGHTYWNCICECGTEKKVRANHLTKKEIKSCGCLNREVASNTMTTHGLTYTPEYKRTKNQERRDKKNALDTQWTMEIQALLFQTQPKCVVCSTIDNLSVDHVIPLSKGYGLRPGNAIVLCVSCNSRKHTRNLDNLPDGWKVKIEKAAYQFLFVWQARHSKKISNSL